MKVVKKKLEDLQRPERNIRMHTDKQIAEFRRSIQMFGQIRPIVIDENNVILAGNGLYETLLQMGHTDADCYIVSGLTEKQKKKLMLSDNRIFNLGVDDMAAFDAFVMELKDDLDIPGFDEDMLKTLVMDTSEADALITGYGVIPEERAEEIKEAHDQYESRDQAAVQNAVEVVREETGYAAPYQANQAERRFLICPKCGERIWL